jgi:hypothetical protein
MNKTACYPFPIRPALPALAPRTNENGLAEAKPLVLLNCFRPRHEIKNRRQPRIALVVQDRIDDRELYEHREFGFDEFALGGR